MIQKFDLKSRMCTPYSHCWRLFNGRKEWKQTAYNNTALFYANTCTGHKDSMGEQVLQRISTSPTLVRELQCRYKQRYLCRRQFTLLLLKHQHNLLCPHFKAPELLGCKKDLQTTEVCVICGGFCHHTASISPEIFKHTMTSHTFISRKPKNGFNDSCFIQLDIILAFSLLIELTFSHIHT